MNNYEIDSEKQYRIVDIQKILNVPQATIGNWVKTKKLKSTKTLTKPLVLGKDLKEFIEAKLAS